MTTDARQQQKKELRSEIKQRLANLSNDEIKEQSEKAQKIILNLPQYQKAKRIGIYLSMPDGEAQTSILVRDAIQSNKKVFVPYIYSVGESKPKRKVMEMLRLISLEEYEGLERDSWGIPKLPAHSALSSRENAMGDIGLMLAADGSLNSPRDHADVESLDLIVVPGVAFDEEGNRMGHGAGFYDSFLNRFVAAGKRRRPHLVGLCLQEQILPPGEIIMQDWDWKVDEVAVGNGDLLNPRDTK